MIEFMRNHNRAKERTMHELSITENLLAECLKTGKENHASRIRRIHVCIGQLNGTVPECVQIYLDMLAEGTIAEGAVIEAEYIPVHVRCLDCGKESDIDRHRLECPFCRSLKLKILRGKEFYIKSMEVDTDGDKGHASDDGLER